MGGTGTGSVFIKGFADGDAATITERLAHEPGVVYKIQPPF
jgi:hypothetical protein